MERIKKIPALLLLLPGVIPVFYAAFFLIQQHRVRMAMEEKLEAGKLKVISISKKEFAWYKKGKEIKIAGELFDVKKWKEENGVVIVKGLFDKEESHLQTQLMNLTRQKDKNSAAAVFWGKIIYQFNGITQTGNWELTPETLTQIKRFSFYQSSLIDVTLPVVSPPPQV